MVAVGPSSALDMGRQVRASKSAYAFSGIRGTSGMKLTTEIEILALRLGATCGAIAKWKDKGVVPDGWRVRLRAAWPHRSNLEALKGYRVSKGISRRRAQ